MCALVVHILSSWIENKPIRTCWFLTSESRIQVDIYLKTMKNYLLSENVRQELIKFLSNYPYRDVVPVISALAQLKEVEEKPTKDK